MYLSSSLLKTVKYSAITLGLLKFAGIVGVIILTRNTDEDITGVVSPALLVIIVSTITVIAATVLQRRSFR
jgi:hypothetical protein